MYAICSQGYRLQGADAEDAFQDVFLRVYDRLGTLRNPEALRPWIAQLTRRVCLDRIAAGRREEPSDLEPEGIEATVEELDEAFAVREALGELPEECQEVLDRFFCRDESYRTIGEELGIPAGNDREPHLALPRPAPAAPRGMTGRNRPTRTSSEVST